MINADMLKLIKRSSHQVILEKESLITMPRFLNRLLGLPVELQNSVFSYFADTLHAIIAIAKRSGKYDGGIMDFGASGEHVTLEESQEFECDPALGPANRTELHRVCVELGSQSASQHGIPCCFFRKFILSSVAAPYASTHCRSARIESRYKLAEK